MPVACTFENDVPPASYDLYAVCGAVCNFGEQIKESGGQDCVSCGKLAGCNLRTEENAPKQFESGALLNFAVIDLASIGKTENE
mmetsp:Transcript_56117/g.109860  ORF Transcript_56117/g.109860 Transcript_56117/m.109860 type:complete len:84 (-) Transcript_56117:37-288(-)